jgi:hypothetical protein
VVVHVRARRREGQTFQLPANGAVSNKLVTFDMAKDNCDW